MGISLIPTFGPDSPAMKTISENASPRHRHLCHVGNPATTRLGRPAGHLFLSKGTPMLAYLLTVQNLLLGRLERDEKGATAVEYGLMVALIAVAIIAAVTLVGTNLSSMFSSVASKL